MKAVSDSQSVQARNDSTQEWVWKEAKASATLAFYLLFSKPHRPWEWPSESPMLLFHPLMMLGNLQVSMEWPSLPLALWLGAMFESHGEFGKGSPIPLQCVCSENFELEIPQSPF